MAEEEAEVSLSIRNEEQEEEEDLSWADSCINNSPDDDDSDNNNNWGTFREALTEIIDINPEICATVQSLDTDMTETETHNLELNSSSNEEEVSEIVSLLPFESNSSRNSLLQQEHYFPLDNPTNLEEEEEAELLLSSQAVFKDEFMSGVSIQDNGVSEEDFSVKVTNPKEIFKVWDLEVDDDEEEEEDGLVLELKKALDESSSSSSAVVQPRFNDGVGKSSVDDLIAGISDLSITETF